MANSISSVTSASTSTSTASTTSSTATSSLTSALFQASGLASGMDTNSIVNSLIAADSGPLNALRQRQSDYNVQISTLGTLVTQLQALQTAASNLSTNGVVAIQPTSTFSDFTVTGSAKAEGSYTISVEQVAKEAKLRSTHFASAQDAAVVPDGNLVFSIDGKNAVTIDTTGKTLADIAVAINENIAGLNASVISTTTGYYLNVARKETGFTTTAAAALTVVSDPGLGLTGFQDAQNAKLKIDGLAVERQSNTIADVVAGATLHLTGHSNVDNAVTFAANSANTEAALNSFVSAYNTLGATVRSQLVTDPSVAYGDTLLDHSSMSTIQSAMQRMLSQVVVPSGSVRILADLGLELQRDGTITLNALSLEKAISTNSGAVNAIFSTGTTGIAAVVKTFVTNQTSATRGALTTKQTSLQSNISAMDDRATRMQSNLDMERKRLVAQFTAMEQLISGFTNAGSYLTQIANLKISG
jgi:flagellar hook-associated protein 2